MIEMYRYINAEKISRNSIILNHTDSRVSTFDFLFYLTLGFGILIQVLNYNRQDLVELIFTCSLIIIALLSRRYKRVLCKKVIVFNRENGTVQFSRVFPSIHKTFNFSEINLISKFRIEQTGYKYMKYYLKENNSDKKYYLCNASKNSCLMYFINNFMGSNESFMKNLIEYNRENDNELKKVYHI